MTITKNATVTDVTLVSSGTNTHYLISNTANERVYAVKYGDRVTLGLSEAEGYSDGYFEVDLANSVEGTALEADGKSLTIGPGDITIKANAVASGDTIFTIKIYKETLSGEYQTPAYTTYSTGATESVVDVDAVRELVENEPGYDFTGFSFGFVDENVVIMGNGQTVVGVYFTRNSYKLSTKATNYRAVVNMSDEANYRYEAEASVTGVLNRGYSLAEEDIWVEDLEGNKLEVELSVTIAELGNGTKQYAVFIKNMPAADAVVVFASTNNTDTKFTVVYMFQDITLTNYLEDVRYPRVIKTGETEHVLTREDIGFDELVVDGFKPSYSSIDGEIVEILGDGSVIVYIYFNRDQFVLSLTFEDPMNGLIVDSLSVTGHGIQELTTLEWYVYSGQTVTIEFELDAGFTFGGFEVNGIKREETSTRLRVVITDSDMDVTIYIVAQTDIEYRIEYYRQELVDNKASDKYNRVHYINLHGTANEYLAPEAFLEMYVENLESIEGYRPEMFKGLRFDHYEVSIKGLPTDHPVVSGDGSTIIRFYYNRILVNVSFEYESEFTANHLESLSGDGEYAYGSEVTLEAKARPGYVFDHWTINGQTIMTPTYKFAINQEVDYVVLVGTRLGEAEYTLEHYYEILGDSGHELKYTDKNKGTTESVIDVMSALREDPGYSFSYCENGAENAIIMGDGSTVVRIYYIINYVEFKVTFSEGVESVLVEGYGDSNYLELLNYNEYTKIYTYRAKYTKRLSLTVELKAGYKMLGWIVDDNQQPEPNSNVARGFLFDVRPVDFVLTAVAETKKIVIIYDPNNNISSEVIDNDEVLYRTYAILRANTFENGNKLFLGWALSNDGDVAFFDGEEIFINFEDTLTLYAVWRSQPGTMWWIWLVVGVVGALGIAVVVVLLIRKRRKDRAKIMSKQ